MADTKTANPEPIIDGPAVCLTCSADGNRPHQCEDTADCPCGSELCGVAQVVGDPGD